MSKSKKMPKRRNMVAYGAIAACKVVYMKDRRCKRPLDARRSWKAEEH